ncbi:hypothetical protein EON65_44690 [archaeon]|nr:MAG: hypothetical protein EON65_44690 [archaeon]
MSICPVLSFYRGAYSLTHIELYLVQVSKELSEREQRLQIGLSRIANAEVQNNQKEEQLQQFENTLKKRAFDCDVRERELLSRRKEMESWDALLREKDRKISAEQKSLDERENT